MLSLPSSPAPQWRTWHVGKRFTVPRIKILRLQLPTYPLFETSHAETSAQWLHVGLLPNHRTNRVDFAISAVRLLNPFPFAPTLAEFLNCKLHFGSIRATWRSVHAAVHAKPTFRDKTLFDIVFWVFKHHSTPFDNAAIASAALASAFLVLTAAILRG
jgi:hypothetical protein